MLGQSRQRSYELRCADPVPVRWTDAWVEVQLVEHIDPAPDPECHCGAAWTPHASGLESILRGYS